MALNGLWRSPLTSWFKKKNAHTFLLFIIGKIHPVLFSFAVKSEEREKEVARENLWWQATVVWSYCANQRTRVTIWPWRKTDRCIVIGCLLIDLVMMIDTNRSMIVRFVLPATRGFLLSLLSHSSLSSLSLSSLLSPLSSLLSSLFSLFTAKENLWDQGTLLFEKKYYVQANEHRPLFVMIEVWYLPWYTESVWQWCRHHQEEFPWSAPSSLDTHTQNISAV